MRFQLFTKKCITTTVIYNHSCCNLHFFTITVYQVPLLKHCQRITHTANKFQMNIFFTVCCTVPHVVRPLPEFISNLSLDDLISLTRTPKLRLVCKASLKTHISRHLTDHPQIKIIFKNHILRFYKMYYRNKLL